MRPLTGTNGIIQLTPNDVVADPFPHAIKQDIFLPDFYRELKAEFPSDSLFDNRGTYFGARTGRDLYQGDPGFDEMLESRPAWREFYRHMHSREFLQFTMGTNVVLQKGTRGWSRHCGLAKIWGFSFFALTILTTA